VRYGSAVDSYEHAVNLLVPHKEGNFLTMNVTAKSTVFCIVMPCISETAKYFGGTHRLRLQGRGVCHARNQQKQAVIC
jgi:hypothetical protein